jgi:hypothetical protein
MKLPAASCGELQAKANKLKLFGIFERFKIICVRIFIRGCIYVFFI